MHRIDIMEKGVTITRDTKAIEIETMTDQEKSMKDQDKIDTIDKDRTNTTDKETDKIEIKKIMMLVIEGTVITGIAIKIMKGTTKIEKIKKNLRNLIPIEDVAVQETVQVEDLILNAKEAILLVLHRVRQIEILIR